MSPPAALTLSRSNVRLNFLHLTDNRNEPDMTDKNSDWLWKMRNLSETINEKFSKFYSPCEHLAIDKVINYKGRVIFRQYIHKIHKCFGIKIYKLCDKAGYMYNMIVYLGRDSELRSTLQQLTLQYQN
jgi:hypothetical protein